MRTETSKLQKNNGHSIAPEFELDDFILDFITFVVTGAKFNGQETIKNSSKITDTLTDSPSNFFQKHYGQD